MAVLVATPLLTAGFAPNAMATVELELTDVTNSVTTGIILGAPCGSATCVSFSGMVARGPST